MFHCAHPAMLVNSNLRGVATLMVCVCANCFVTLLNRYTSPLSSYSIMMRNIQNDLVRAWYAAMTRYWLPAMSKAVTPMHSTAAEPHEMLCCGANPVPLNM